MTISYNNTPVHFTAKGTGNPMVLLHGFLESSTIWTPFLPVLSNNRRVICIDLPGHGETGTMGEVHSMELQARVVKAVLDDIGEKKITLVGHSMGGYVCLAFLDEYPEMVNRIVLMNSTPEADNDARKENRDRAVKLISRNKEKYVSMAISNLLNSGNNEKFFAQINDLKKVAMEFPKDGIIASIKGMKIRTDRINVLKKFCFNKSIIIGKKDPVNDWERVRNIAIACGCEVILTENGHLSYMEDYTEVREYLHFID